MALQDLPDFPQKATSFPYGSPEYQAQEIPFLEQQLQAEAQRAANARGVMYSGPAMADEQQAASNLLYQMSQAGAQQSMAQQQLQEQQAFAQQQALQAQQAQASQLMQQQREANKSGEKQALYSGAGSLGGMYLANKMGLFGHPAGNPLLAGGGGPESPLVNAGTQQMNAATPWYSREIPGTENLFSAGNPTSAGTAGGLAAGLGGGLLGYNLGGGPKGELASQLGGGLGGLLGYGGAALAGAGPWGLGLGALAGSFGGRQIGNFFNKMF